MRYFLFASLFFLAAVSAAQPRFELKTDLLRPFFRSAELGLEYFPEEQFSLEIDARLDGNVTAYRKDRREEPSHGTPAKVMVLTTLLSGKLFSPVQPQAGRFFTGCYLRTDLHFNRARNAEEREFGWLSMPTYFPNYDNLLERRLLRTALGAVVGYKVRIGRRGLVEAGFGADVAIKNLSKFSSLKAGRMLIGSLKAGYRL